ncbi:MAG: SDR family NAD(P)-dependent oxidoreductase [Flavobacterium sp.]|nr:MAG: SDR family NAD(P)-dependent oxidoreductase [Flavobacterium sp.]
MDSPFSLTNKKILVIGASSGLGKRIAIESAALGANLILLGRNEDRLKQTLAALKEGDHSYEVVDINHTESVNALVSKLPGLDGVVNSAGIVESQLFSFLKEDSIRQIMETNFFSPVLLIQKLVKKKKINKPGSIVFLSSVSGPLLTYIGNSSYSASKSAITGIAKTMALELAPKQIRVNCLVPAMIKTELLGNIASSEEDLSSDEQNYPLGGYGQPEDVAYAAIYLLSDASKWITGINLKIDGGLTLR